MYAYHYHFGTRLMPSPGISVDLDVVPGVIFRGMGVVVVGLPTFKPLRYMTLHVHKEDQWTISIF